MDSLVVYPWYVMGMGRLHTIAKFYTFICLFQRLRQAGAIVTTSESTMFQLVGRADHPNFKMVQALLKESAPTSGLVSSNM